MDKYKIFWRRLAAAFIDELVLFPLTYLGTYFQNENSSFTFIAWSLFHTTAYAIYFVWFHARSGQTIGKKILGIKIVTLDERHVIGLISALKREAIWIIADIVGLIYFSTKLIQTSNSNIGNLTEDLNNFVGTTALIWIAIEMITMLLNSKRRAIHDFIAGSVVIKI